MRPQNILKNVFGPIVNKHLIALFVDDFGSVRIKDKTACNCLLANGIQDGLYMYDTLMSEQDLCALFEMCNSIHDYQNNPVCVTPFAIMANPDFKRIKESGYQKYFREPFTDTLKKYGIGYERAYDLWKQGQVEGVFKPAFHGTEHMNVKKWMKALQNGHKSTLIGFENECVCVPPFEDEIVIEGMVKECEIEKKSDLDLLFDDIKIGADIFRKYIGDEPALFTPGAGTYSPLFESSLLQCGIKYLDVARKKIQPLGDGKFTKQYHYLGQKNKIGQRYIVRNCSFEPVRDGDCAVTTCYDQIGCAFIMRKPAIISTHRLNYIGHFDENNRMENLRRLKILLNMVQQSWPDVEFVSGKEICNLY